MNCPYCDFHFKVFAVNSATEIPEVAPLVCEGCTKVSILKDGQLYTLTPEQLEIVKQSPAWEFIEKAQAIIRRNIKRKKARFN